MLQTLNLTVYAGHGRRQLAILKEIDFEALPGKMIAIIGPSGCGKSTFLKAIAGLMHRTDGKILWQNQEITADHDIEPEMLAYVPQFGIFHEELTVSEILTDATILRTGKYENEFLQERISQVADLTGLSDLLMREAKVLSGGQKRRLALAMELVSEPSIILADEVTSGLDPKSALEITTLLRNLTADGRKIVLHVTHELKHLHYYDGVVVFSDGFLVYQGPPASLTKYFQASEPEDIFQRLSDLPSYQLENAWRTARPSHDIPQAEVNQIAGTPARSSFGITRWLAQLYCLIRRRFKVFVRNKGQIFLQAFLLLLFPPIVVLFALKGLPEIQNMNLNLETNPAQMLKDVLDYSSQVSQVGRLVSGLAMFQVILLALMGANNSAREIAAERGIFEKERLSGLSASAYLMSKMVFLLLLVLAQSLWMTILVKLVCTLPGSFWEQFVVLGLVDLSLTCLSLAISAWARTAEQASLIALYAVGFQLPLSGAVLALPDWLALTTKPLIAAYWGWAGYLETLKDTRLYDLVSSAVSTNLETWELGVAVLVFQSVVFTIVAYLGCYRSGLSE